MLFAAGFGTRMRPLTDACPKPLIPVAGRPLIDRTLDLARAVKPRTIVANLHYLPDLIEEHLAGGDVQTLRESPNILDTGGGLRHALPLLGQAPLITMNTDAVWVGPNPARLLIDGWNSALMDALLVCVPLKQTRAYDGKGDFEIGPDGQLQRGHGLVYGGVQMTKTDLLKNVKKEAFSLNEIWSQMAEANRLFGLIYPGFWCDVGHPGGIAEAETLLAHQNV